LSTDIKEILTTFNQWFSGSNTSICLVESLREKGGGYARLGGMYLNGLNQTSYFKKRKGYTRYLSHEIAHLWWHRANTNSWQDWLNEGFAEYSALMVLREQYGPVYFDKWLDLKKKKIKDTEPVWHCDRNGKNAYAILYSKAPVLLNKLEQKIGQKKFKKLMKGMLRNQVSTTAEFLDLLEKQQGSETKKWFTTELKSF
jgi:aminopeptidase N